MKNMNIKGLQCDKPGCNYVDMSINVEDYKEYIDRPCPECGSSLLTQIDYDIVQKLIEIAENLPEGEETEKCSVKLNGTGRIEFDCGTNKIVLNGKGN